jgi:hypothetical protein
VLAAFLSLGLGILASMTMLDGLTRLIGHGQSDPTSSLPMTVQVLVWVIGLISFPLVTILTIHETRRRYRQWRRRAALRRAAAHSELQAARCHCLRFGWITDADAVLYAAQHLRPAPEAAPVAAALNRSPADAIIALSCRDTGILWLGADLAPDRPAVLLRGTAPYSSPENPDDAPGMYL